MTKKISWILLLVLLMTFASCGPFAAQTGDESGEAGGTVDPAVGDGTPYTDFITVMKDIVSYGDRTAAAGLPAHAEYYYSFAGASVGAFRFAVENVLWLRGEGGKFADFVADSRYTGWDIIAEINYSSPYPSYFEGLICEVQGKREEAIELYAASSVMTAFPEEGLDFYYLKKMSIGSLYALRDELRSVEDSIYAGYTPVLSGRERDFAAFDPEYLLDLSAEAIKKDDYGGALVYAKDALKTGPFDPSIWQGAVLAAIYAEDFELAGEYLDEGLTVFPDDAGLCGLKKTFADASDAMTEAE
jgi:tetratricopeptide (TPR) repeat protein